MTLPLGRPRKLVIDVGGRKERERETESERERERPRGRQRELAKGRRERERDPWRTPSGGRARVRWPTLFS